MTSQLRCLTCKDRPILTKGFCGDATIVIIHVLGGHFVQEEILISDIVDTDRQRKDYGDVTGLAESIKRYGLIQPIVLQETSVGSDGHSGVGPGPRLVAGGRRLAALRFLGWTGLRHGKEFVWRDEDLSSPEGSLRLQAVELEENLKRQDLQWHEVILAKAKLFELMQSLHRGVSPAPDGGRLTQGFSLRKLAAMLGENPSVTSRDLDLAGYVAKHPALAQMPTKADALRKLGVAVTVAAMQNLAKTSQVPASNTLVGNTTKTNEDALTTAGGGTFQVPPLPVSDERWMLYSGDFQDNIQNVQDESIDLVLTDLPYLIGLGTSSASHGAGLGGFEDTDIDISLLCSDVAIQSYRVLRDHRFAIYFFGMNYYKELYDTLTTAGFTVDVYPFIWLRDRTAPPDGFARFSKSYDPALVASKGTPRFVRPNQANTIAIPSVRGPERLHNAQKPVALMEKFILDTTTPNCVVLDMFAGSGTTGEAALKNGRKAILFEKEEANCILIKSRLSIL
jgi:site-specific DNA-methyltransferase (adenine-specific)